MEHYNVRRSHPALYYQQEVLFSEFPSAADALRGIAALEATGYDRSGLAIVSAEPGYDPRPRSVFQFFTDGYEELRQYARELAAGRSLLTVRVADRAAATRAAQVLRQAGGANLTYFGTWVVETLHGGATATAAPPDAGITGQVSAGAGTTIGSYVLPEMLSAFHRAYPRIALSLMIADSAVVEARLHNGELDVGVVEGPTTHAAAECMIADRLVVIIPPEHRLANNHSVSVTELLHEPFLLRESGSGTRDAVLKGLAQRGVTPNVVMEIGGTEAIKRAVRAGLGISIVSAVAVEDEVAMEQLRALPLTEGPLTRPFTVVRRPDDQAPHVEHLFLESLRAYLGTVVHGEAV